MVTEVGANIPSFGVIALWYWCHTAKPPKIGTRCKINKKGANQNNKVQSA